MTLYFNFTTTFQRNMSYDAILYWTKNRTWSCGKINDSSVAEFTQFTKFESGSIFFSFFFLLFMTSACYSLLKNDALMENWQINFQVYDIFHYRSLGPSTAEICCCCRKIQKLRPVNVVSAYSWSRDPISMTEKTDGDAVLPALLKRHLVASTWHPG